MKSNGEKEADAAADLLVRLRAGEAAPTAVLVPPDVIGAPGRGADSIIHLT